MHPSIRTELGLDGETAESQPGEGARTGPELQRLQGSYQQEDYFVPGTDWSDYLPAFRHGLLIAWRHQSLDARCFEDDWHDIRGASRLGAKQALPAVMHAMREAGA